MQVAGKIEEVNKILKQKCLSDGMSFIDNFSIVRLDKEAMKIVTF